MLPTNSPIYPQLAFNPVEAEKTSNTNSFASTNSQLTEANNSPINQCALVALDHKILPEETSLNKNAKNTSIPTHAYDRSFEKLLLDGDMEQLNFRIDQFINVF